MENLTVTKNNPFVIYFATTNRYEINWEQVRKAAALTKQEIKTKEEYRSWLYEWRIIEKQMVSAIRFMRSLKNEYKNKQNQEPDKKTNINRVWYYKKTLSGYARSLYNARNIQKENYKLGNFLENK